MRLDPVIRFYLLAFAISWLGWLPAILGSHGLGPFDQPHFQILLILPAVGPALAAVIATRTGDSGEPIGELFTPLLQWRVPLWGYVAAVSGPVVLLLAAQAVTNWLGLAPMAPLPEGDRLPLALSALVVSVSSNPWEEVGWRGFALRRLQRRFTALLATLIVGALWAAWHIPLFFWKGHPFSEYPFVPWTMATTAGAFIYTWLYNGSRGSLIPVTLYHIAMNAFGVLIGGVAILALALVHAVAAAILLATFGSANLSPQERVRAG